MKRFIAITLVVGTSLFGFASQASAGGQISVQIGFDGPNCSYLTVFSSWAPKSGQSVLQIEVRDVTTGAQRAFGAHPITPSQNTYDQSISSSSLPSGQYDTWLAIVRITNGIRKILGGRTREKVNCTYP